MTQEGTLKYFHKDSLCYISAQPRALLVLGYLPALWGA